jgi:hypothetical protein
MKKLILIYRGDVKHPLNVPVLISVLPGIPANAELSGPSILFLAIWWIQKSIPSKHHSRPTASYSTALALMIPTPAVYRRFAQAIG